MKKFNRIRIREKLSSNYWFVPTLMTGMAIALALMTLMLDKAGKSGIFERFGYTGGADGALTLLSTIANSMITVAVTAFSVTLVALSLASQQFGPRVLRNFMQDKSYQLVLGTFTATFIYCLLVMRTVHTDKDQPFVPHISLTVAILLTFASIGMLIYFIHHATTSIHAWHIIGKISDELNDSIDYLFSERIGHSRQQLPGKMLPNHNEACSIFATESGYIQAIDRKRLMNIAKSKDVVIHLKYRPGKFVVEGSELVVIHFGKHVKTLHSASLHKQINNAFILGGERTANQDVEFSIKQLVEIAIRAISPAINDPFTAIRCIDQLCAALCRLAEKDFPSADRYDNNNDLRVITNQVTFAGLLDDAFHQIRQYGRSDVAVTIRLLEGTAVIAQHIRHKQDALALLRHVRMIRRGSQEGLPEELDRKDVEAQYQEVIETLTNIIGEGG